MDRVAGLTPVLILGYFALHVLLRVTAPGGLGLDEAEQMVATQSLEWGYGPQPPLYSWLQWAVFQLTGPGKLGLALLKNVTMGVAYLALWAAALRATGSHRLAMVASLSLMLLPPIAWEAQRALSHSVLAVALAALTVLVVLGRRGAPRWVDVIVLGLLLAAGALAKLNYLYLAAGLAGALALTPEARSPRWLASSAVAAVVLVPAILWMIGHPELMAQSTRKFGLAAEAGWPGAALDGLVALVVAVLAFAALLLVAHAALFWWRRPAGPAGDPGILRFLQLWLGLGLAAVALSVLAVGATEVKERWLQPVLLALPLAATLAAARRIDAAGTRWFLGVVGVLAVAVLVALPLNLRRGGDNPSYQSAPFGDAAALLPDGPALALVADDFLAGNLRLVRPELAVLTPQKPALDLAGSPRLAVWWSRDERRPAPEALAALVRTRAGLDLDRLPQQARAFRYPPPHQDRLFHLGWAVLEPPATE